VHDQVVRIAIDLGYPFRDDLVVDTSEALRVASLRAKPAGHKVHPLSGLGTTKTLPRQNNPRQSSDSANGPSFDPEPPLVSFPPGWKPTPKNQEREIILRPITQVPIARSRSKPQPIDVQTPIASPKVEGRSGEESAEIDATSKEIEAAVAIAKR
jgi:hypothetical protein